MSAPQPAPSNQKGPDVALEKNALVISYAEHADYICVTARRSAASPPNDQGDADLPRRQQ